METQRRSAYDLAEKYQCTIVEEILDEGVSSRKKDREGYKRLIAAAYEKRFITKFCDLVTKKRKH